MASAGHVGVALERRYGSFLGHPRGLTVIFLSEMWERFSYYGMRALLMLFMVENLAYSTRRAGHIYGLYTGGAYLTGILAGYVSDRALGAQRAMLFGGVLMTLGHFAMAAPGNEVFFAALAAIAVGTGFFKPNSAALVGHLYAPDDPRRERAYALYYLGVNVGSFLAVLICGYLGQNVGWHWGFCAAGVGMTLGLVVLVAGRAHIGGLDPEPAPVATVKASLAAQANGSPPLTKIERGKMMAVLLLGVLGNIAFWATFEQAGSSLNLFAQQSTRLLLPVVEWRMPASWLLAANPVFIILLTPAFVVLWRRLAAAGRTPSTVTKFVIALVLVAAGFGVMMGAGALSDRIGPVSVAWLLTTYFLHTLGELMIAPVGLSVVSRLSPPRYTSMLMSLWFATIAIADWLGGQLAGQYGAGSKARFFSIPAVAALLAACALAANGRRLRRLMHDVL